MTMFLFLIKNEEMGDNFNFCYLNPFPVTYFGTTFFFENDSTLLISEV